MGEPAESDGAAGQAEATRISRPSAEEIALHTLASLVDAAFAAEGAVASWAAGSPDADSAAVYAQATSLRKTAQQLAITMARAAIPGPVDAGDTIYRHEPIPAGDTETCATHLDRPAVGTTISGAGQGTRRYACQQCWDEAKPWTPQLAREHLTSIGWDE